MQSEPKKDARDPDALAVCLAIVRGQISIEQARQALGRRTPAAPASGLLGLGPALLAEAADPARLRGEDISACLGLLERLLPERSGRELLAQEETLGRMLVEAGRLSQEELNEYLSVQRGLVNSGERPLPGLADMLKSGSGEAPAGESHVPRIPGYELKEVLGKGAMGTVYRARQSKLDRWVAVKVMKKELAQDPHFIQQFQTEARTAGKLRHENIVSALDCGQAGGEYYFIMEFVEGNQLGRILKEQGTLPEGEALRIAIQVARALDYAWDHRIVHQDVKPGNILLTPEKEVKICDLGLCKDLRFASGEARVEGFSCTPSYASPEQARRQQDLDCRTDIYSLGIVLYHMVTGAPPFHGKPRELLAKQLTEVPASPKSRAPAISTGLDRLILDMIEKDRDKRPGTPREVIHRMEALAAPPAHAEKPKPATARSSTSSTGRTPRTTRRNLPPVGAGGWRRPSALLLGAGGVGIGVAVVLASWVGSKSEEPPPAAPVARPVRPAVPSPATTPPAAPSPRSPAAAALAHLQALESASTSPMDLLFACDEVRKTLQGTPEEARFRELEQRALRARETSGKEEQFRKYVQQVRKMIDEDSSFGRSAEILRMLHSAGRGSAELQALVADYEGRLNKAAREARDEILRVALPLRQEKRFNDALALIRGFPEGLRSTPPGLELERLDQEIDRQWSAQIALEQGRAKWAGWKIRWGEDGALPTVRPAREGRTLVLATSGSDGGGPFALEREFSLPDDGPSIVSAWVAAEPGEPWEIRASVKDTVLVRQVVGKDNGDWEMIRVDLSSFQGNSVRLRLEAKAIGGRKATCYWGDILQGSAK